MLKVLAVLGLLMEIAALIMAWPLCRGWHPELVTPFLICFGGGAALLLLLMCTRDYWYAVLGVPPKYPWGS